MKIYDASGFDSKLTGSFTGSFYGDGSNLTGIVTYTKAEISGSSTLTSASLAASISNILDGTSTVASASTAITASFALNAGAGTGFPFSGSADITGSLYVSGGNISGSFVGDGSGLSGINIEQSTITSASFSNVSEYTASHSFNTKQLLVSTYFNDDTQFFPQEVKILDDTKVALKFNTNTSGRVVIAKAGHVISGSFAAENATVTDSFTGATSKTVTHGFGTKNVIVQVYEGDNVFNPDSISTTDNNNITVTFGTPRTGRIVVAKGGHIVTGVAESVEYSNILNKPTLISSSTPPFPHTGSAIISGSLRVIGSVTADTYIVSSSITYTTQSFSSGSTAFGNSLDDKHLFTGSVDITGSLTLTGNAYFTSSKVYNNNTSSGSLSFWQGSQTEYDAISSSADPNTFYIIRS